MSSDSSTVPHVAFKLANGDELLTREELARRIGKADRTPEQWRITYDDTPEPIVARNVALYRRSEWEEWLARHNEIRVPGDLGTPAAGEVIEGTDS